MSQGQAYFLDLALDDAYEFNGPSVVWTAVCLCIEHPELPALRVLDRAVLAHADEDLDFQFEEDELHPPHPFAELLRRAFAPQVDPMELYTSLVGDPPTLDTDLIVRRARIKRRWSHALLRFAERYRIWEPD
jgi:hypothetical protein